MLRVHTTSAGTDPARLIPGSDLVLELDEAHGFDLPAGALAHDYLTIEDRRRADQLSLDAVAGWREGHDALLTVDGICLPWIWEWEIFEAFGPVIWRALGLLHAVEQRRPPRLALVDRDPGTELLVKAVAQHCDLPVDFLEPSDRLAATASIERPTPPLRRLRRTLLGPMTRLGVPSLLRRDGILFDCYWPLMPLLDRMLAERPWRPTVAFGSRPTGPMRSLRAAAQGGWLGTPGPGQRRRARRQAARLREALLEAPQVEVGGLALGACVHPGVLELVERRAEADLADAALLRKAFGKQRIAQVVGAWDIEPSSRLLVSLAQEAGVPTLLLAHGAYTLPQPMSDLEVCDEVALWTEAVAPPITNRSRPIHLVGYPLPHDPPPTKIRDDSGESPRILVVAQSWVPSTAMIDARIIMRQYITALEGVRARFPDGRVTLRPHPAHGLATSEAVRKRFPDAQIEVDVTSEVLDLLRGADVCVGATSAATLQAALVGTPVVVLNLTGYDWPWPLGGETTVPVAHSAAELSRWMERWAEGEVLPGREALLAALGADGEDATRRLMEILAKDR